MIEKVLERIEEIKKAIEQSLANHHGLLGMLQEAQRFYELIVQLEQENK